MIHAYNLLPLGSLMPSGYDWLIIAFIALLLFGKRLPEVGKSLGQGIVEFKKGLHGIEDEVNQSAQQNPKEMLPPPDPRPTETTASASQTTAVK